MIDAPALPAASPHIFARLNCSREALEKICKEYDVIELSVFGSVVRDDFDPKKSDIDFMVVFDPDATLGLIGYEDLRRRLARKTRRRVDLVSKNWLSADFRDRVLPEARVVYAAG